MINILFFMLVCYITLRLFIWSFGALSEALLDYNEKEMSKRALKRNSKKSKKIRFARGAGKR